MLPGGLRNDYPRAFMMVPLVPLVGLHGGLIHIACEPSYSSICAIHELSWWSHYATREFFQGGPVCPGASSRKLLMLANLFTVGAFIS